LDEHVVEAKAFTDPHATTRAAIATSHMRARMWAESGVGRENANMEDSYEPSGLRGKALRESGDSKEQP
jgi:hypothetical protein